MPKLFNSSPLFRRGIFVVPAVIYSMSPIVDLLQPGISRSAVTKNAVGQWYFNVPAGKKEILARRIGRNEIAAIYICGALVQYFSQKHGGVKQYAQKFISDAGQQNGLY
jgi:hypothetical protein